MWPKYSPTINECFLLCFSSEVHQAYGHISCSNEPRYSTNTHSAIDHEGVYTPNYWDEIQYAKNAFHHILFGGNQLTLERIRGAKNTRANSSKTNLWDFYQLSKTGMHRWHYWRKVLSPVCIIMFYTYTNNILKWIIQQQYSALRHCCITLLLYLY